MSTKKVDDYATRHGLSNNAAGMTVAALALALSRKRAAQLPASAAKVPSAVNRGE